jgi:hypothetical protein
VQVDLGSQKESGYGTAEHANQRTTSLPRHVETRTVAKKALAANKL